jgi:hypothetical protein
MSIQIARHSRGAAARGKRLRRSISYLNMIARHDSTISAGLMQAELFCDCVHAGED